MADSRVIGVISGKGGVGKTSLSVNLGVSLSEMGKEVTIVDTDFSAPNLGVHLGRYDHPVKIQDVLKGEADPSSAVFRHPTGIKAMVSSNELYGVDPETRHLEEIIAHATEDSDYVIVDCPPGIDSKVENVMEASEELLIVTIPTQTASINAAQIIEKAKEMKKPVLGTVVNMAEDDPSKELIEREIEMMTECHIMSNIPHDPKMKSSIFENTPLVVHEPLSEASLEIKRLAAQISDEEFEEPSFVGIKRNLKKLVDRIQN